MHVQPTYTHISFVLAFATEISETISWKWEQVYIGFTLRTVHSSIPVNILAACRCITGLNQMTHRHKHQPKLLCTYFLAFLPLLPTLLLEELSWSNGCLRDIGWLVTVSKATGRKTWKTESTLHSRWELGLHSLQPPSLVQCHIHTWEVHMEYLSYKQIPRCATVSSSNGSVSSLCWLGFSAACSVQRTRNKMRDWFRVLLGVNTVWGGTWVTV